MVGGRCTCSPGYYLDDSRYSKGSQCKECKVDDCQQCRDEKSCDMCKMGYYLNQDDRKSYSSKTSCDHCRPECKTCDNSQTCTSCTSPKVLDRNGSCALCNTTSGYFVDSNVCKQCKNCNSCEGEADNQCLKGTCQGGRQFVPQSATKAGVGTCITCDESNGYFIKDTVCLSCDKSCRTCKGTGPTDCITCKNASEILGEDKKCGECQITNGFYVESNSAGSRCKSCNSNCKNCQNSSTQCTQCNALMGIDNGICVKCEQKDGVFIDEYGKCMKCDAACKTCLKAGSQNCVECADGYTLDSKICKKCDQNTGNYIASNKTCQKCHDNCSTCRDGGNTKQSCITCKGTNKWVYLDYTALDDNQMECNICKTNQGFYANSNSICKPCPSNCVQCSLQTAAGDTVKCDKCKNDYYFNGDTNDCIQCNTTTSNFYVENGLKCKVCDVTCQSCTTGGPNGCSTCATGYLMSQENRTCVKCDQPGELKSNDNKNCFKCQGNCSDCNPTQLSECLSCKSGFSLMPDKTCQKCEGNNFIQSGNICLPCHYTCNGCQSSGADSCINCATGYNRSVNTSPTSCINCPSQKYYVNTTNNVCTPCNTECLECSGISNTDCTKCQSGEDPHATANGGMCKTQCAVNEYFRMSCLPCHPSCAICNNASDSADEIKQCIECAGTKKKKLQAGTTSVYICIDCDINNGQYQDNVYCYDCTAPNCAKCTGDKGSVCTECQPGKYLLNGNCVDCTNDGYYRESTTGVSLCQQCPSNCKTCNPTCTQCMDNFYFNSSNECISCPNELFYKDGVNCKSCNSKCLKCENGSEEQNCTVCKNNQYLIDGKCSSCPTIKYFEKKDDKKCLKCDSSCETCTDEKPESCIQCDVGLYVHQEGGKSFCKECNEKNKYFIDTDLVCKPCTSPCDNCFGINTNQCLSCLNGLSLMKDSTCQECKTNENYYRDPETQECQLCHSSCKTCNGISENNCTACKDSQFLDEKNMCADCNLPRQFKDTVNKKCIGCHTSCQTCDGNKENNCLTCISQYSYFESEKTCKDCPGDRFYQKDQKCLKCHDTCKTCSGPDNTDCNSCVDNYSWNSQDLCEKCPVEEYFIDKDNTCLKCPPSCKQCKSETVCDICTQGLFIDEVTKLCVKCEEMKGSFPDKINNTCKKCDKSCSTCTGPSSSDCSACSENYFQIRGSNECQLCQKTSSFTQQAANCARCEIECSVCMNSDTYMPIQKFIKPSSYNDNLCQQCKCLQCKWGFTLVDGQCVSDCSTYGQNFEDDPRNKSCKCREGYKYQMFDIITVPKRQFCSKTQIEGYYCRENSNKCFSCPLNCNKCSSPFVCDICNPTFFLWEGKCLSSCFPEKNIVANSNNQTCECEQGYIYIEGKLGGEETTCLIPLKLERIEISNPFMNTSDKQSTSTPTLNNLFTFVLNRKPRQNEIEDFQIWMNDSKLIKETDYFIRKVEFVNNLIQVEVEVNQNRRVSDLKYTLNGQTNTITLKNVILTTKEYNKAQIGEGGSTSENMQSISGFLTPKEGGTKDLLDNLKRFQILCFLSNFVQVLAPISIFKDSIPPQVYIGGQLGASFIFSDLQAVNQVSFQQNSTSIDDTTPKKQQNSEQEIIKDKKSRLSLDDTPQSQIISANPQTTNTDKLPITSESKPNNENGIKPNTGNNTKPDLNKIKPILNTVPNSENGKKPGEKPIDDKDQNQSGNKYQPNSDERKPQNPSLGDKDKDRDRDRDRDNDKNKDKDKDRPYPSPNNNSTDTQNKSQQSEQDIEQDQKLVLLSGFGLKEYLYANFIIVHLIIVISSILIALCLIARRILPGKQYTLQIVDNVVNIVVSFSQGSITSGLFSIYYSLQFSSGRGLAIFQLLIHAIFLIELIFLIKARPIEYIESNIPNFFDGINSKARGAKSYILISFFKKYIVILLFLIFSEHAIPCSICIAVLFFLHGAYIGKYRFFLNRFMNYSKIMQEWIISALFILLAICMKKYKDILDSEVISDDILEQTKKFSFLIIVLIITCLTLSLLIFIYRSVVTSSKIIQLILRYIQDKRSKESKFNSQDLAEMSMMSSRKHSSHFSKQLLVSKQIIVKHLPLPVVKTKLKKLHSPNLTETDD